MAKDFLKSVDTEKKGQLNLNDFLYYFSLIVSPKLPNEGFDAAMNALFEEVH
jgi:hypothetical protein